MDPSPSAAEGDAWSQPCATLVPAELFRILRGAESILLAVSGGPDSTALMHLAARWRDGQHDVPIAVATVDHGLRPEASAEAETVATQARALGFDATVLKWGGPKPRRVSQERARSARYALLEACAAALGATHLVTAHTLDDQAETLLFRLARGSGLTGLVGMRPVAIRGTLRHVRPLLGTRKNDLVALCQREGWPFVADPSNADPAYARTRWRALAPRLEAEGLTAERLGRLAERLRRADTALDVMARKAGTAATLAHADGSIVLAMSVLAPYPDEIVLRVLASALTAIASHPSVRLQRLESLVGTILQAFAAGRRLRRTLCHCVITLEGEGTLTIRPEAARRGSAAPTPARTMTLANPD